VYIQQPLLVRQRRVASPNVHTLSRGDELDERHPSGPTPRAAAAAAAATAAAAARLHEKNGVLALLRRPKHRFFVQCRVYGNRFRVYGVCEAMVLQQGTRCEQQEARRPHAP